jgi:poly(3-hydroxyalkanoate) synthetase
MPVGVLVVLGVVAAAGVAAVWWWITPSATDRTLLTPTPLRRAMRWYRARVLRALTIPIGWPHVVDLAFGAGTAETRTPGEVVWRRGDTTLTRYAGDATHNEPVLVVHSLVTDATILDLTPRRSVVRHLRDSGFDVYLLDWGPVGAPDLYKGLAQYGETLRGAELAVLHASGAKRVHVVAYCLSSTLVLTDMANYPRAHVGSLSLLAPLADFAVPGGLRPLLSWRYLRPVLLLDEDGCVPAAVVREAFHAVRPQAIAALRLRITRRNDEEYREFYAAFARWAWNQRRLPGALLFDLIDLYRHNALSSAPFPSRCCWRSPSATTSCRAVRRTC